MKKTIMLLLLITLARAIFGEDEFKELFKTEIKECFEKNRVYSKEITEMEEFEIDLDGDKKNEVFKIRKLENSDGIMTIENISINNKKIDMEILEGAYYTQFLKINNKILLGFGYSDNGVDPSSKFYEYKNSSLKLFIDEEISYVTGAKENKIFSWWDAIFGENWKDELEIKKENYTKYYDTIQKKWVINREVIGKKVKNDFINLLIFKDSNVEVELKGSIDNENTVKSLNKVCQMNKNKIKGVLKIGENFEILSYREDDILYIRTDDGKVGYIDRKHMVYY